jgi:hypothetical protein
MRRRSTIFSLPGLVILVVLLTGLGLILWQQGGLAFSPGPLSSGALSDVFSGDYTSHADFEQQCSQCHQPLTSVQGELCIACHTNVSEQIITSRSLHGSIEIVMQCAECHSDHLGRDFDLRLGHLEDFDHSNLNFTLIWHQVDYSMTSMDCLNCHVADGQFSTSIESCANCHAGNDIDFVILHLREFGEGCTDCHDGKDSLARFDHSTTEFPLSGMHLEQNCADCHKEGHFADLSSGCIDCHAEPVLHQGVFDLKCGECHDSQAWQPALLDGRQFDHFTQSGFDLVMHGQDFRGGSITCDTCHQAGWDDFNVDTCILCHAGNEPDFVDQHRAQLGDNCVDCHDGIDRMMIFDHGELFPLDGRHGEVECQACHLNQVYQDTPQECADCHLEPQIHAGFFGLKCEYCHITDSWYPGQLRSHQFPINHGNQLEADCELCHSAIYQEYTCFECHDHQPEAIRKDHLEVGVAADELYECVLCHEDGLVHELIEGES